jgi:hypothetical protein
VGGWRLLKNSRTVSRKSIYGTPAGGWVGFSAAVAVAQRLLKSGLRIDQGVCKLDPSGFRIDPGGSK